MSKIGTEFEVLFSKLFNLERVRGSGNQTFYKLDVEGRRILLSLKATKNKSFSVKESDLQEMIDQIYGPGGLGAEYVPALAICLVQGDEPSASDPMFIITEANDFHRIFQEKVKLFPIDKSSEKISIGEVPGLFRQDD